MTVKKVATTFSAVLVLALLCAPGARADAPLFYTDPDEILLEGEDNFGTAVTLHGNLVLESGIAHIFDITCDVHGYGELWNSDVPDGEGTITQLDISEPCPTNVPGCVVIQSTADTDPPISITTTDAETDIDFSKPDITLVFNDGCTGLGIPPGIGIAMKGDLTGSTTTEGCVVFDTDGDMTSSTGQVATSGKVCFTDLDLLEPQGKGSITIQ